MAFNKYSQEGSVRMGTRSQIAKYARSLRDISLEFSLEVVQLDLKVWAKNVHIFL